MLPENYLYAIEEELHRDKADAFGGPDRAHNSFTDTQKAISYSMTSFFTTGGIRGGKKKMRKLEEMKRDSKQYLEIKTPKNIKQVLNIIDSIIAGQRFAQLDSDKQMYLLSCQSKIQNMIDDKFTRADIKLS